jgi:hypothetical protein
MNRPLKNRERQLGELAPLHAHRVDAAGEHRRWRRQVWVIAADGGVQERAELLVMRAHPAEGQGGGPEQLRRRLAGRAPRIRMYPVFNHAADGLCIWHDEQAEVRCT